MISRIQGWATSAILASYGFAVLIATKHDHAILSLAVALLSIGAAIALLLNYWWGRWLTLAVGAIVTGFLLLALFSANFRWGIRHSSPLDTAYAILQALGIAAVVAYCLYIAFRSNRRSSQT